MIPEQFIEECKARGGRPWDEWHAMEDDALNRLVDLAKSREDQSVTLTDSRAMAEEMFGQYGEETIASMSIKLTTYGIGCQVWDMRFFTEDGSRIPDDEAWAEVRRNLEENPDMEDDWEFGRTTIIRWVLR